MAKKPKIIPNSVLQKSYKNFYIIASDNSLFGKRMDIIKCIGRDKYSCKILKSNGVEYPARVSIGYLVLTGSIRPFSHQVYADLASEKISATVKDKLHKFIDTL